LAPVAQILGESLQDVAQQPGAAPVLKAPMAGLVRRIASRQVVPRGARAQDPEGPIERGPRVGPRATAPIGAPLRTKQRFEYVPLLVGEVHAFDVRQTSLLVHQPRQGFMR
jgi:hypothetical protein